MRRTIPALMLVASLAGCSAQELASVAAVLADMPSPKPGAAASPGAMPGGLPGGVPSAAPGVKPPAGPVAPSPKPSARPSSGGLPGGVGGLPIAVPSVDLPLISNGGSFAWEPKWTEKAFPGEPTVEHLILKYTNEERAKEGLPALGPNRKLDVAARQHSTEMIDLDYFEHASPVAGNESVSDRQKNAGYMATGGENIYDYYEVDDATRLARELVDGWMDSPGHRANILRDSYRELGVGIHRGRGRVMATQVFGSGQVIDVASMTLLPTEDGYRVVILGTVGDTEYRSVRVTLDGEPVSDEIPANPGQPIKIEAQIPAGGAHELGVDRYDPKDGGRQFWPFPLFTIDTSKPVDQAVR